MTVKELIEKLKSHSNQDAEVNIYAYIHAECDEGNVEIPDLKELRVFESIGDMGNFCFIDAIERNFDDDDNNLKWMLEHHKQL